MKIHDIRISTTYIPQWHNNREQEPEDQLVIEFKSIPNSLSKNKYVSFNFKEDKVSIHKDYSLFAYTFIKEIKNLEVGDKQIKTVEDLLSVNNPKLVSLLDELIDYCFPADEEIPN